MKRLLSLLLLLSLLPPMAAQEVVLPPKVRVARPGIPIQIIPLEIDGGTPEWKVSPGLTRFDVSKLIELDDGEEPIAVPPDKKDKLDPKVDPKDIPLPKPRPSIKMKGLVVYGEAEGTYDVWAWNAKGSKASKLATMKVIVGAPTPVPPGPVPPGPVPPDPTPSSSPFAEAGFRVLISFDGANTTRPVGERWFMGPDKAVRDYLNARCVLGPASEKDGHGQTMHEWRMWPATTTDGQPTDVSAARKVFLDAWTAKGPEKKDWILIGDGRTGYSGPLPKTADEALNLLKKYGGQ